MNKKIVVVDIDGILTTYPHCFLDWVDETGLGNYKTIMEMKYRVGLTRYEQIKETYRSSGIKRTLPINTFYVELLHQCSKHGFYIWVVTTRPKIQPVYNDTIVWLKNNNVPYNEITFVDNKKNFLRDTIKKEGDAIHIIIDDEITKLLE